MRRPDEVVVIGPEADESRCRIKRVKNPLRQETPHKWRGTDHEQQGKHECPDPVFSFPQSAESGNSGQSREHDQSRKPRYAALGKMRGNFCQQGKLRRPCVPAVIIKQCDRLPVVRKPRIDRRCPEVCNGVDDGAADMVVDGKTEIRPAVDLKRIDQSAYADRESKDDGKNNIKSLPPRQKEGLPPEYAPDHRKQQTERQITAIVRKQPERTGCGPDGGAEKRRQ